MIREWFCFARRVCSYSSVLTPNWGLDSATLGSFSIDEGNGNDDATNKEFDWSSEEK